jgi:hypothetical protein
LSYLSLASLSTSENIARLIIIFPLSRKNYLQDDKSAFLYHAVLNHAVFNHTVFNHAATASSPAGSIPEHAKVKAFFRYGLWIRKL